MLKEKQPKGLYLLFFTELWERFGYRSLQAILVLFLTKSLLYSDKMAYFIFGAFNSMLYLTPVAGGYLADRYLGHQRAVIIGGVLFTIGYLLTSLPQQEFFFFGLCVVILGNGFLKPNISTLVGDLYVRDDPRKDSGFTLFYMGINIGSVIPPLIIGWIVYFWGWHFGFLLAAIGMIIGLVIFLLGRKSLGKSGHIPEKSPLLIKKTKRKFDTILYSLIVLSALSLYVIFLFPEETTLILIVASIIIYGFVFYFLKKQKGRERQKMLASLILILISVGFWSIFNQGSTSVILFADRNMTKSFLGIPINAEFSQVFNPFFIIVLSPIMSRYWLHLESRNKDLSTPMKFSLASVFMAIGFLLLGIGVNYFSENGWASPWWLAISFIFQTLGELFLSPIGLAMITKLSPKNLVGMMMGVWFLTQTVSYAISSELALLADVPKSATRFESLFIYSHAFLIYGLISVGLAIISFLFVPFLNRLIEKPSLPKQ